MAVLKWNFILKHRWQARFDPQAIVGQTVRLMIFIIFTVMISHIWNILLSKNGEVIYF